MIIAMSLKRMQLDFETIIWLLLGCQKLSFDAFVEAWDKEQTQLHEDKFTHIQLKVRWANLPTNAPKNKLQTMP